MSWRFTLALLLLASQVGLGLSQTPSPESPLRFKWQQGQVLAYKVVQKTVVQETTLDEKTQKPVTAETHTNMTLVRRWTVKNVDASGIAAVEMGIIEFKQEIRQADGSVVTLDSAVPANAKDLAEFLNKPILTVRVNGQGKLIEVKESKPGSAARLQAELPFRLTLPDAGPVAGQTWDRPFALKLDPPLGAGETYDFLQKYSCKQLKDGLAVIGVETSLKAIPKTTGEQIPLVPMLWNGDVYFNAAAGKYHAARLTAKAELADHLGEGSKFVYHSVYTEDALEK